MDKFLKAVWEMLTAPRYQFLWWTLVVFNICFIVVVKYLDYQYPPSVCFCDCDYTEGLLSDSCLDLDCQKAILKRWGALEDCSNICAQEGKIVTKELTYQEYKDKITGCNEQIKDLCDNSLGGVFCGV